MHNTQSIDSWLQNHAYHQKDKPALHFSGNTYTYEQLLNQVNSQTCGLYNELGLRRGDRIAFYGHNSDVEIILLFAAARLGITVVLLNWRLASEELKFIIADSSPKYIFYGPEFSEAIDTVSEGLNIHSVCTTDQLVHLTKSADAVDAIPPADLSDPFVICYTSGTTGRPKGAVLTQSAILWNALSSIHAHDFKASDHVLNSLPLFHVGGLNIQMFPCFFMGGTVTLQSSFDPGEVLKSLQNDGITLAVWVPTMIRAILAHPLWESGHFPEIRLLNTGSTDVPVELLEQIHSRGIPMVQVYGATETGPVTIYQREAEAHLSRGSIGRCGAHSQVRLVNNDGNGCKIGQAGEIWVKGPNNFSGYWNNQEATDKAISDGWFKTGDIAYQDDQGLFWFSGRSKHVIISGGENIYPAELERIINQLPNVVEAAVVGRKDEKWGEIPVVAAVVEEGLVSKQQVLDSCRGRVARFKQPKDVIFVDALPKNALGKILVDDLRKIVAN